MYDQKIIAIVLSLIEYKHTSPIIKEIVSFIQKIDNDDQIYLFDKQIFEYKSQSIPFLVNYQFKTPLEILLKDAVQNAIGIDQENLIFVISDHSKNFNNFEMKKILERNKNIFFYGPNDKLAKFSEDYQLKYTIVNNYNQLSEQMLQDYLGEHGDTYEIN